MVALDILTVLMAITSVGVFGLRKYKKSIYLYSLGTFLLVCIFMLLSFKYDISTLRNWALIAFFIKVILVPLILLKLVKKLDVINEDEPVGGFFVAVIVAVAFSLAVSMLLYKVFMEFSLLKDELPLFVSAFIFMMGIFGFILRNSFIKQILSYCLFENGIHLSLALMAYDSHELVELGILTDAVFAVIIMSVLAARFYKIYGCLDTSKATNLKG
ncbi:hydrogenase 4 membrane subunit [Campylobacter geochelonis]|uniref:Hydrogenase 4 membrane subunit n=1 Tax=Campylobacter geochelonis TaxID=1780362 RepID=A0A128ECH0_9BACT|nr:hydrogenase 4 membrane subunit [Campylobacter geochelonis]QKF72144.1 hydrogenase-4, antiporter-like subunit [Campylobacter geochelonis]CZE45985.1 hydrogenase 4 membrane subunit [Campylobacter geochelonis]CZE46639.1 hydrogenase 4 membrane subunit [Campylobacter geochelonis]CZE49772.1 hydrogenase 4 membrane subunit [Campylobacter geochelonis]